MAKWSLRAAVALIVCSGLTYVWFSDVLPFRSHQESLRRLEVTVGRLAINRPREFTRDEWSFIIGWTQNAVGNCCGYPDAITDIGEFEAFSIEAEQRARSDSAIQTIEWMWDQFELVSKNGPSYSSQWRPTSEGRLRDASRVKIGPPVP